MQQVGTECRWQLRHAEWLILLIIAGCSSGTNPPLTSSSQNPSGTYHFSLNVTNILPLNTATGKYVLWVKMLGDSTWYVKPLNYWTVGVGSLNFQDTIQLPRTLDSIGSAYVSIEPMALPAMPSDILMSGTFDSVLDTANLSFANTGAVGNYSSAGASVIFTTQSSDTNQARREFYLMKFVNGLPTATAMNMPVPPLGWAYGLWVLDSNFYPIHEFFYGWFRNADSASSEWGAAQYQFPGGFEPPALTDPGARLEVTMEPEFSVLANKPKGPSPLTILWMQLRRFIDLNDTASLANAWNVTGPEGKLAITK